MQKVRTCALYIVEDKGLPARRTECVFIEMHGGIRGDYHCKDPKAPLCVSTCGIEDWIEGEEVKGLCFRRFKANILLDAKEVNLGTGTRLCGGNAELEVTGRKGSCHETCARYKAQLPCRLREEVWFARGTRAGQLREGEHLLIAPNHE